MVVIKCTIGCHNSSNTGVQVRHRHGMGIKGRGSEQWKLAIWPTLARMQNTSIKNMSGEFSMGSQTERINSGVMMELNVAD